MQFTLTIELGDVVNTPVEVAELLTNVLNEIREDGLTDGVHDVQTRAQWRQSEDGESSELVRYTVGKWEVRETPQAELTPAQRRSIGEIGL
jgi:hypothetical protein